MRIDSNSAGYTLVEMLIALAVGSIVVGGAYASYSIVANQYNKIKDVSEMHTSGRNIMRMIERDIRMAGFEYRDAKANVVYGSISEPLIIKDSGNKCCDEVTVTYDYHDNTNNKTERVRIRYWAENYTGAKGTRGRLYKQRDILGQRGEILSKPIIGNKDVMADYIEDLQFAGDGLESPVAYYPFSGNANDKTGNGNNGIAKELSLAKDQGGAKDNAYYFSGGMSEHIVVNKFPNITNDLSITAWIKPEKLSRIHPVVTKGYSKEPYTLWVLKDGGVGLMVNWGYSGRIDCFDWTPRSTTKWYHIAGVKDSSDNKIKLFANGRRVHECSYSKPIHSNSEPLYIGSSYPGGREYYTGYMDEVCIFNRALSDSEVSKVASSYKNSCDSSVSSLINIDLILRTKKQYGRNKQYKKKDYFAGNYKIDKTDGYKRDEFSNSVLVRNLAL